MRSFANLDSTCKSSSTGSRSALVLPVGVDKSTGFRAAMAELRLPASRVIGIGDAENDDYAFLNLSGFSVAVGNAIPSLKEIEFTP